MTIDLVDDPDDLVMAVGAEWPGDPFRVELDHVLAYARVIDHPLEAIERTGVAPPVFASVASMSAHSGLLRRLVPHDQLWTTVHLSQSMWFREGIRVGDEVTSNARLLEVRAGSFGCSMTIGVEVCVGGRLVTYAVHRVLIRGRFPTYKRGTVPVDGTRASSRERAEIGRVEHDIGSERSLRYSEVSRDVLPIHTDRDVARQAGFEDLILHGMCTFALCVEAVVDVVAAGAHQRLSAISATFTRPVVCGRPLSVQVLRDAVGSVHVAASQSRRPVIRDGWAVVDE